MALILCDVDGVVADLHASWLARYNRDWNDTLTTEQVLDWAIHRFVKPECEHRIYDYLQQIDLYDDVPPVEGALAGVETLRKMGHEILFLTDATPEHVEPKYEWLRSHGFLSKPQEYRVEKEKWRVKGDVLIDDGPHNIEAYPGPTVLVCRPHNHALEHPHRCRTWDEIVARVPLLVASQHTRAIPRSSHGA